MRFSRLGCVLVLASLLGSPGTAQAPLERFEYSQRHMGVQTRVVLYAPDSVTARDGARAAFQRIATLDSLMSDYRTDSELNQLSDRAGMGPVSVSPELFHVLSRAQELARLSGGAFDVTASPLVRLWRQARRTGELPSAEERRRAAAHVGWELLHLDSLDRSVRLVKPGMRLDLGGIAKGYAADEALRVLRERGVERALIEMGGDIAVSGPPPGEAGWRVRVANAPPEQRWIQLTHAAVSTSGDTEQFVEIDGVRYSHVVDPATGLGLRSRVAATVIATEGALADALSTLLTVLGPDCGRKWLQEHFPAVNAYIRSVERSDTGAADEESGIRRP